MPAELDAVFDDIARLAPLVPLPRLPARQRARLRRARGVSDERLRNYHKLLREARRDSSRRWSARCWCRSGRPGGGRRASVRK